jgi:hypothetical protein
MRLNHTILAREESLTIAWRLRTALASLDAADAKGLSAYVQREFYCIYLD